MRNPAGAVGNGRAGGGVRTEPNLETEDALDALRYKAVGSEVE